MPASVTPEFRQALAKAKVVTELAAAQAMNFAIQAVAREAKHFAPWNADGTEGPTRDPSHRRSWIVSGYSRASFIGAVPKYFEPSFKSGSETDKYGHFHSYQPWTPHDQSRPGQVQAYLWRYSNNTRILQEMEQGSYPQAEWTPPGEITEVATLRSMQQIFWAMVATVFAEQMRILFGKVGGGFIF
jgi:hypothetical protein